MDFEKKYKLHLKPGIDFNVKQNHALPAKMGAEVFVFGKTMYCRNSIDEIPKHEYLHIAQFRKYGRFLVLLHYLFFILINLLRFRNFGKAFMNVPFEVEARKFEAEFKKEEF